MSVAPNAYLHLGFWLDRGTGFHTRTPSPSPEFPWLKKLPRLLLQPLIVNRPRSRICSRYLPLDLLPQRHPAYKTRSVQMGRPQGRPGRGKPCPNTGESSAGDQSIARRIRGIIAFHFANIFHAAVIANQQRQ